MPRMSFSAAAIAKLPRKKKPGEFTDPRYPNLVLRLLKSGRMSWLVRLPRESDPRRPGKMRRPGVTLGSYPSLSLAGAVRRYQEELTKHAEGDDAASRIRRLEREISELRREQGTEITVAEMAEDFLESIRDTHKASTLRGYESSVRHHILPVLGECSAALLESHEISEAFADSGRVSEGRWMTTLSVLRMSYRRAISKGLLRHNPCRELRTASPKSRDRYLDAQELVHVWRAIRVGSFSASTRDALQLLLMTGQRLNEVAGLPWSEIRGNLWTLPAERTKPKRTNYIPLLPLTRSLLDSRRELDRTWCFRSNFSTESIHGSSVSHAMNRISKALVRDGLIAEPFRTHDLRRTVATWMGNLGAEQLSIKAVLNHRDHSVTAVYDRARYIERAHDALGRWDLFLQVLRRYL